MRQKKLRKTKTKAVCSYGNCLVVGRNNKQIVVLKSTKPVKVTLGKKVTQQGDSAFNNFSAPSKVKQVYFGL